MESHVMPNQLGQSGRLTFDLNWFLDARNALDSNQKLYIANELHSCISQLRNLKGDYIGAVGHGKAIIGRRISLECGPFDSEQQFNDFILGDIVRSAPNILRHYAKHALMDNHEIFFSLIRISSRGIFWLKEGMSRQSSIGKMLVGIRNIGNTLRRFDN